MSIIEIDEAGLAVARARKSHVGRPARVTPAGAEALLREHEAGTSITALAEAFGVSRPVIRRAMERARAARAEGAYPPSSRLVEYHFSPQRPLEQGKP